MEIALMKFLVASVSISLLLFASACSTTENSSTPILAAAKQSSQSTAGGLKEKDYTFTTPSGFQGPTLMSKKKRSRLNAFTSLEEKGTVITVHSGYSKTPLWDPSPEMQQSVVEPYLKKMITGIKNRRSNYGQSEIEFINVNGIQMGKISWTGDGDQGPMKGAMYSFLKSGNNHTISVQGFSSSSNSIQKAYDAVENIEIGE